MAEETSSCLSRWRVAAALLVFYVLTAALLLLTLNSVYDSIVHNLAKLSSTTNYLNSSEPQLRLVCYYVTPDPNKKFDDLRLTDVNSNLCTHINIGMADVSNSAIVLSPNLKRILQKDVPILRSENPNLKFLLWIGGGESSSAGFPAMVKNHTMRKVFIRSVKAVLRQFTLDGIDLDWEFPSAHNKERQHFSQLLYEIRQEYRRERRNYLLTIAVAAPEGLALFAYDVLEINKYADFVNLMSYDYHFYSRGTPFTGLNAPLYARNNEQSILSTLNINYSVNWWLANGLERQKLVVGLPTYGHSFTLVNIFNKKIGAPAEAIGHCGSDGFASYSEICWFNSRSLEVSLFYDDTSCSPYLSSGTEWISYENEISIECKTQYVKSNKLGGVMVFSLNTDDTKNYCSHRSYSTHGRFPLIERVKKVLFTRQDLNGSELATIHI